MLYLTLCSQLHTFERGSEKKDLKAVQRLLHNIHLKAPIKPTFYMLHFYNENASKAHDIIKTANVSDLEADDTT